MSNKTCVLILTVSLLIGMATVVLSKYEFAVENNDPPTYYTTWLTNLKSRNEILKDSILTISELLNNKYKEYNYEIARNIYYGTRESNNPAMLLVALVLVESNGNPAALGKRGEIGLFQIHPRYWKGRFKICGDNLYEIATNVCYGVNILAKLQKDQKYRLWKPILRKYNGGSEDVYTNKILRIADSLEALGDLGGFKLNSSVTVSKIKNN